MPFEQMLRDRLIDEAAAVKLPERDPQRAVARARTRRHRRTAAVGVTTVAAVAVAAVTLLQGDPTGESVTTPGAGTLQPVGPLDLDWRAADGGLSGVSSQFQTVEGTVYALSTGPGVRYADFPDGDFPRSLYTLAEDGTWQELPLDGDRPRAVQMAGANGELYSVSTGPAPSGDGSVARLGVSADGGETWAVDDVTELDPPSSVHDWRRSTSMDVETAAGTTIAAVTTSFHPDLEALFPELDDDLGMTVEYRDEGLVLVRYETDAAADGRPRPSPTEPPTSATFPPLPSEDVQTVPWADLGVSGTADLSASQLFRRAGDTWEPFDTDFTATPGFVQLQVAGDRFVVQVWPSTLGTVAPEPQMYTSADGSTWEQVEAPGTERIIGVGGSLVSIDWEPDKSKVSTDGGRTWSALDLSQIGDGVDGVGGAGGGPLGLALVLHNAEGRPESLAVSADLVDWTVTPLDDIVGPGAQGMVDVFVGQDRIVVQATREGEPPAPTVTAVGTPRRS
jgi:hypothetical protein